MKKILLAALTTLMAIGGAMAADFGGRKYYVNPGHGGHDSDDRPTPLPLGVEIFYESDGALTRGFAIRDFLQANNGQVKMSRTQNRSADDLGLSTIAAQSNSYGGYFMSLHTNGANASANYICAMYGSTSGGAQLVGGSKVMAQACANWHNHNHFTSFTYSTPRALADYPFYGYNLGVLRTNTRPGYLVETVFHDYRPDALRMKSDAHNKYHAWQIVRAAMENSGGSPGATGNFKGCLVGDIRCTSKSCGYTNYVSRDRDKYLAINGATVKLYNSAGTQLKSFTTDNCANGFYAFFDLDPGTYSVEMVKDGYQTQRKTVTVSNNAATKANFDAVPGQSTGISVNPGQWLFTLTLGQPSVYVDFAVTGAGLSSAITAAFDVPTTEYSLSYPTALSKTGGTIRVTYHPTTEGRSDVNIKLTSGTYTATIPVGGNALPKPLSYVEGWNVSDKAGNATDYGWDATKVRNIAYNKGKLYMVYDQSDILVIDARNPGNILGKLKKGDIVKGGTRTLSDVRVFNGKVVACNFATKANNENLRVYVWDDDNSEPYLALDCPPTSWEGCTELGDCIGWKQSGTWASSEFIFIQCCDDATRVMRYPVTNGMGSNNFSLTRLDDDAGLKQYACGKSSRIMPDGTGWWIMGGSYQAGHCGKPEQDPVNKAITFVKVDLMLNQCQTVWGNDLKMFAYKGSQYVIMTDFLKKEVSGDNLLGGKFRVVKPVSGSWVLGEDIGNYPEQGLSDKNKNTERATSLALDYKDGEFVETWLCSSKQGVAYFTVEGSKVPSYTVGPVGDAVAQTPYVTATPSKVSLSAEINKSASQTVSVAGGNLEGDINITLGGADAQYFSIDKNAIAQAAAKGDVKVTYAPTVKGTHTANLTIESQGAPTLTVAITGEGKEPAPVVYNGKLGALTEKWCHKSTSACPWLTLESGDNMTRSLAVAGDNLYILNSLRAATEVVVANAYTGTKTGVLDLTGIDHGTHYLGALESDGTNVFGSNYASSTQNLRVYVWKNGQGAPVKLVDDAVGIDAGESFGLTGTLENGRVAFSNGEKVVWYQLTNGKAGARQTITLATPLSGTRSKCEVTFESDGTFWLTSTASYPTHYSASGAVLGTFGPESVLGSKYGTSLKFFTFGGHKYAAVTSTFSNSTTAWNGGHVRILNVDNGTSAATLEGTYPTNGFGSTNYGLLTGVQTMAHSITGTAANNFNLWALTPGQGAGHYQFNGIVDAVSEIGLDQVDANAEYFTLQGIRVAADRLTPGMYIQRTAAKTQKVVIR